MCITPLRFTIVDRYEREREIEVGCRRCWQCRADRVNDWVGRAIAESRTSAATVFGTATYGGDRMYAGEVMKNPRAQAIFYEDFQGLMKRVRHHTKGGVRFFCAAEAGGWKGRVHFHFLWFFDQEVTPNIEYARRYLHFAETPEEAVRNGSRYSTGKPIWDAGHVWYEPGGVGNARYMCKYLLKDQADDEAALVKTKTMGLSCKPPLGYDYFVHILVPKYIEAEVPLRDLSYFFGDVRHKRTNQVVRFRLRGRMARHYVDAYLRAWRSRHGDRPWPYSELVEAHLDDEAWRLGGPDRRLVDNDDHWLLTKREGLNPCRSLPQIYGLLEPEGLYQAPDGRQFRWNAYAEQSGR